MNNQDRRMKQIFPGLLSIINRIKAEWELLSEKTAGRSPCRDTSG